MASDYYTRSWGKDDLKAPMLFCGNLLNYLLGVGIIKGNPSTTYMFSFSKSTCRARCGCSSKTETRRCSIITAGSWTKDKWGHSCICTGCGCRFALLRKQ